MFPMAWFRSQQDIDLGILESTTVLWCRKELVGGLEHVFPYIGNNHPNWLILFRGVETTNQTMFSWCTKQCPKVLTTSDHRWIPAAHRALKHSEQQWQLQRLAGWGIGTWSFWGRFKEPFVVPFLGYGRRVKNLEVWCKYLIYHIDVTIRSGALERPLEPAWARFHITMKQSAPRTWQSLAGIVSFPGKTHQALG